MNKKGFTLIELLAVIVILAIIALIAIPLIGNVIEKAKIGALESSVNGLVESANMYYANNTIKGETVSETTFDFEDGEQVSTQKLEYKGKVYNGKLILHAAGEVAVCIDDAEHYAYKEKDSDEVISGIGTCLYNGTTGDFTIESGSDVIIKECEEDKKELQEQITNLTSTVNNLQQTINEKEQAISDLISVKEGLENQVTTLEGEKEELIKQIENSNLSNSELNTKITELEGTIDTLESSIEAKNNEITVLNGEKANLQTELTEKTNELKTLNENLGKVTASASDVLSGKTILTSNGLVTGTMSNKSGTTTATSTITESGDNALITIPTAGYYSTSSKISVPIETIKNEVISVNTNFQLLTSKVNNTSNTATISGTYNILKNGTIIIAGGGGVASSSSGGVGVSVSKNGTSQSSIFSNGGSISRQYVWVLGVSAGDTITVTCHISASPEHQMSFAIFGENGTI